MITPNNVTTIYVSQKNGNDKETGFLPVSDERKNGPLKNLYWALECVRQLRFFGAMQPITIKIMDEEYYLDKPVVIGNGLGSVTIEPYIKTLISGGIKINNFKKDTFNGVECFSAYVPEVAENGLWFTDLYVDNCHAKFTRYPQEGTLKPVSVDNNDTALSTHSKWFIADKKDLEKIKSFKNFNDCFISYNHYWVDEHTPIESYDIETGKILCKYKSRFSVSSKYPQSAMQYIIENVAEEFKNPNEWYLDRETSKVYYIPKDKSQKPENISVFAPICEKLFVVQGTKEQSAQNVYIRGFEFAYTKGDYCSIGTNIQNEDIVDDGDGFASDAQAVSFAPGSIEFEYAQNCIIENCKIHSLGIHGVNLKKGCKHIRICNNEIYDLGGGGISVGGKNDKDNICDLTGDNFISNNIIKSIGRRYLSACGILMRHSYNNTISHNDISDTYYTGISVGWMWGYDDNVSNNNIIEYNHIYNIGQGVLSDMGGVYLLGKQQGTIVRNNIIHDIKSKHYGGWGIYTDEGSSYILVENNICYNISCNCYHQHFGYANTVRNNIFVKSGEAPAKVSRAEMQLGIIFDRNIMVSEGTPIYMLGYEGRIYAADGHFNLVYDKKNDEPKLYEIDDEIYNLEKLQEVFGLEYGTIITDPEFSDYDNNEFVLNENSPAFEIGFKAIDIKKVGVQ